MNGPFKMKGWSPFTKKTGNQLFDVTGDGGGSTRLNPLIEKHKGSASVDSPPPYISGRGQDGLNYRKWRRQFVKELKDQ